MCVLVNTVGVCTCVCLPNMLIACMYTCVYCVYIVSIQCMCGCVGVFSYVL